VAIACLFTVAGPVPLFAQPAGVSRAGHEPSGHEPSGHEPSGREPSGREPSGHEPKAPAEVTLEQALQLASRRSPELQARRAEVEQARARVVTAGTPAFDPELGVSAGHRDSSGGSTIDRGIELSQELELGGKRRQRKAAASAEAGAAEARFARSSQVLAARVALAFADALRTRDLLAIAETDVELAGSSAEVARKRLEAGAGTDIEVNLAVAAGARAERRRQQALAATEAARFVLAEAIGLPPGEAPAPIGDLAPPGAAGLELDPLLAVARARRADLEALRRDLSAAEARVRLARAEGAPDLRVALFHETEADDDVTGLRLGIGLPVVHRSRGAVLEAGAAGERARWEATALERSIEREVAESWSSLRAAEAAAGRFDDEVVGSFEENLRLLRRSFEAGKIGVSEVLLFRREFLDAQRESIESRADARRARVLVDFAAGTLELPGHEPEGDAPEVQP
jgi:cobalt-zinc-cadmium efflux system outer membrane protein